MNSKECLKKLFDNQSYCSECDYYHECNYNNSLCREWYNTIKQELERYDQFKLDYLVVEKYACKYKSLISGKLWRDGKERTKWFNKIRNQKDWIDCLSKLREFESNDEEQFLRVVKHLDTQVLYWALSSLEKEIKRYSEEKFEDDK